MSNLFKPKAALLDELCVFGYNRKKEKEYDVIIPPLVITLILSYFAEMDYFDKHKEQLMVISGKTRNIVTNCVYGCHTVYGSQLIDLKSNRNVIYEWTFKCIKLSNYYAIGIDSTYDAVNEYPFNAELGESMITRKCYGLHGFGSGYASMDNVDDFVRFGYYMSDGYGTGDVIVLKLNAKKRSISFSKNGRDYGSFDKDINLYVEYRVFVFLNETNDQVEMTKFDAICNP